MAVNTVNLNSVYKRYIHVPTLKSDPLSPLYALSDMNDTEALKLLNASDEWKMACRNNYNSPTNVRRIFISKNNVLIEFHKPMIVKGKPDEQGKFRKFTVKENLDDAYRGVIKQAQSGITYNDKDSTIYKIEGTPLRGLTTPWVLSNIEEIYVDPFVLLSQSVYSELNLSILNVISLIKDGKLSQLNNNPNIGANIVKALTGLNLESVKKQLPRLRFIGIIPELGGLIQSEVIKKFVVNLNKTYRYLGASMLNNEDSPLSHNKCFVFRIESPEVGIETRNRYKFDKEILTAYANSYQNEKSNALAELINAKKAITEAEAEANPSEFDAMLRGVSNQNGLAVIALKLAVQKLSADKKNELKQALTKSSLETFESSLN